MSNVATWRAEAARRAEQQRANEPTALITLPEFPLFPFIGRRLPWQEWIANGLIPESLSNQLAAQADDREVEDDSAPLSGAEAQAWIRFRQRVISSVTVDPHIVFDDRPLKENDIHAAELPDDLLQAIYRWAMALSSGVPVMTTNGMTTVGAVETFRHDNLGTPESAGVGLPLPEVRAESGAVDRAAG